MKPSTPKRCTALDDVEDPSLEEFGSFGQDDIEWIDAIVHSSRDMPETKTRSSHKNATTAFQTPLSSPTQRRNSSDLVLSQEEESITVPQFKLRKRPATEHEVALSSPKTVRLEHSVSVYHQAPILSRRSSSTSLSTAHTTPSKAPTTPSTTRSIHRSFESKFKDHVESTGPAVDGDHATGARPLPIEEPASAPTNTSCGKEAGFDVEAYLNRNVKSRSAFPTLLPETDVFSRRVCYEVTRVSLHTGVSEPDLYQALKGQKSVDFSCYGDLWSALANCVDKKAKLSNGSREINPGLPERCSDDAWSKAEKFMEHLDLSGDLLMSRKDHDPLFKLKLNPFKVSRPNRASRKYGSDRFFSLNVPHIESGSLPGILKPYTDKVVQYVLEWLQCNKYRFLGREWASWYVKPVERSKSRRSTEPDASVKFGSRVYLFALRGHNLKKREQAMKGDQIELKGINQFLDWALTLDSNKGQSALKLFSRLQLVLSPTHATVEFDARQILRRDNAYSSSPGVWKLEIERSREKKKNPYKKLAHTGSVMNDVSALNLFHASLTPQGCSRMSQKAAQYVAKELGLETVPCAFQGRIAGAKGMWLVAAHEESLPGLSFGMWNNGDLRSDPKVWIELTDDQVKFETTRVHRVSGDPNPDPSKLTLEILDHVKPLTAGFLNLQVLSVLLANGVPLQVFQRLLTEDITDKAEKMKAAMKDPSNLAAFLQKQHPVRSRRVAANGIAMQGGLPSDLVERILFLVNAGFRPDKSRLLRQLCSKQINLGNERLVEKMSIGVGRSTRAFILPDPMDVLAEGECFLYFSSTFEDSKSGEKVVSLHHRDVLVARSPVLQRSDVQKIRAVFKPELEPYKDVVVFSCRGQVSLAHLLSGGDFDGDKVWICWEPEIVAKFKNHTDSTEPMTPQYFEMQPRTTTLAQLMSHPHKDPALDEVAISKFLSDGLSLNMRQSLLPEVNTYYDRYVYNCGYNKTALELSALCGLLLDASKTGIDYTRMDWTRFKATKRLPRDLPIPSFKAKNQNRLMQSKHPIDVLVRRAQELVDELMESFHKEFSPNDVAAYDRDLAAIVMAEESYSRRADPDLKPVLDQLDSDLGGLLTDWAKRVGLFRTGKADETKFRLLCEQLREKFLCIRPLENRSSLRWKWEVEHRGRLSTHGSWTLLKASALFRRAFNGQAAWWICGQELCRIKAEATESVPIVRNMYELISVDTKLVERVKAKGLPLESRDADFDGDGADDSDDDYGWVDWQMAADNLASDTA